MEKGKSVYEPKDRKSKDTASTSDRLFRNVDRTQFWTNIAGVASSQGHFPEVQILANHFGIRFNDPPATITRYKVEIQLVIRFLLVGANKLPMEKLSPKNKSEMRLVVEQLYSQHPMHFPPDKSAYSGSEYIFSANVHDTREFTVNIPDKSYYYIINVVEVDQVELSKLREYFSDPETISGEDRAILFQGLDSLMKESPTRNMIRILRRNFYEKKPKRSLIGSGAAVHTGFKQSLKLTSQGPALCLDYSAVLFYKTNFDDYLRDTVSGYRGMEDLGTYRDQVERVLNGLKIRATHTNIRYTFVGLTRENTGDLDFVEKPGPPTVRTTFVDYFQKKLKRDLRFPDQPCLILERFKERPNIFMPIELCELAEGQMYRDQQLDGVHKTSVLAPHIRKKVISETVSDPHGPFSNGVFYKNFGIQLSPHMTVVDGGQINSPVLKLKGTDGKSIYVQVNRDRCDWNYSRRNFAEGKKVEGWAFLNFANVSGEEFIRDLQTESRGLGMDMANLVVVRNYSMDDISSTGKIKEVVGDVVGKCKGRRPLQIIICTITAKYKYYGYLKWFLETKTGVISQCFVAKAYNEVKKKNVFLDNLCMKINGKIGGSNVELGELPHFSDGDRVMLIGADVNHPAAGDKTSSSIAAVVGTVNWPAASRYVARIETQKHRKERIKKFGEMCKDLVDTFSKLNKGKPDKIVVFRDGVGDGQFDKVLSKELRDLKGAIFAGDYEPKITVVLAQKRHHTRIFLGDKDKNVLPGTVVDTVIVDPSKSNFFLCSHYGGMGTSKPVHYYVLRDENEFPLHDLQTLIYHLCFTYARCSKPVSLVTPVYYADRVATRGRKYYEAARKETSDNEAPSSSSSSANPSVNLEDCCKLHRLVKDTMFFL